MLKHSPLGQPTTYVETYSPSLLFPIPRTLARDKLNLGNSLPFDGDDIWNGYELSWLNLKGKPEIALAEFYFPCSSPYIVESKSFKLYLNAFNQSHFGSIADVQEIIQKDLTAAAQSPVAVKLTPLSHLNLNAYTLETFPGICLDTLDIATNIYTPHKSFLVTTADNVEETVYTNLLKSNCLATGQPDWGSVLVRYSGPKIDHEGLLKYFISFRRHAGFAEHCVEEIFTDILTCCRPKNLTVYGRYTRRGGLDINPFRSNFEKMESTANARQTRQ